MAIILSILICSLKSRKNTFDELMAILSPQITNEVEVLVDIDEGEKIVGQKRQDLLDKSIGEYVCFIDDDDLISEDYVALILKALESKPDCCSIKGEWIDQFPIRQKWRPQHKVRYMIWGKDYVWNVSKDTYFIGANHITPIKSEIAKKCGFPIISNGEDQEYGKRVRRLIKTETKVDSVIYKYRCDRRHKAIMNALKRHKK